MRLALLIMVALCWWTYTPTLDLRVGEPAPGLVAFLEKQGASCVVDCAGIRLRADRTGLACLQKLCLFHADCLALCVENLSAEKKPYYRRRTAALSPDGRIELKTDMSDYKWVYDPCHPAARHQGPRTGYVPMANVNVVTELALARRHQALLELYQRALQSCAGKYTFFPQLCDSGRKPPKDT